MTSIEEFEDQFLAPYAIKNKDYEGRFYEEENDPYRTNFQRDRDRIIHSKAFRRLGYKTQVFVNTEGDNYRTRLTHSLEVSQLSRSIANILKLNKDFSETIALAHDLGHPPFGHAGQDVLHNLMQHHGGFEHNKQSLRIVTLLEERYPFWKGLNLTKATLKALMKYGEIYEDDVHLFELRNQKKEQFPPLECVLVDQCDRIAYIHHDIEDGIDSRYLELDQLLELDYWKDLYFRLEKEYKDYFKNARLPHKVRMILRYSLNLFIKDFIENSLKNLNKLNLHSIEDVYKLNKELNPLKNSEEFYEITLITYQFLKENLYNHPDVLTMARRGEKIITFLFNEYIHYPEMMPKHIYQRITEFGLHRTVADYISGMTDRYALKKYKELMDF
jgi:dGTPase